MLGQLFSLARRRLSCATLGRVLGLALVLLPVSASMGVAQSGSGDGGGLSSILSQLNPNTVQQVLQGRQQNSTQVVQPSVPAGNSNNGPLGSSGIQLPSGLFSQAPTRLETIMSERAGTPLKLFGYDQLGNASLTNSSPAGAVQDDYILGPGDQLAVSLRGQQQADFQVTVDRDGRVILPNMPPIAAGGRRFGDFRADLDAAVHRAYISTNAYISVAQIRQVSVVVAGDVNQPGVKNLTGLSTPLDAILLAGGISKVGSLRGIRIIRGSRTLPYDLYSILTHHGVSSNFALADGDKIVVPPLGRTVAVTGWVRQPAIYEVAPGTAGMSSRNLVSLAGGLEVRGRYRMVLLRIDQDGIRQFVPVNDGAMVRDGDILFVQPANDEQVGGATLGGSESLSGKYSVGKSGSLAELLKPAGAMGTNPYTLFGVISRRDAHDYQRTLIAFSPLSVLNGGADFALQTDDIVRVFQVDEMHMLVSAVDVYGAQVKTQAQQAYSLNPDEILQQQGSIGVGQSSAAGLLTNGASVDQSQSNLGAGQPNNNPFSSNPNLLPGGNGVPSMMPSNGGNSGANDASQNGNSGNALNNPINAQGANNNAAPNGNQQNNPTGGNQNLQNNPNSNPLPAGQQANAGVPQFSDVVSELKVTPEAFINFLIDHQIRVGGAVADPGIYLVGPAVPLTDVLRAAGGTSRWANTSNIAIVSASVNNLTGTSETTRQTVGGDPAQLESVLIKPRDEIQIQQVYTKLDAGIVNVQGEVVSPGKYPITHGERLSELLVQIGGLSDYAYPYGTVFLRQSIAATEKQMYERTANEMEKQMVTALSRGTASASPNGGLTPEAFTGLQAFVHDLRSQPTVGRMTVVADPSVLAANPDKDPMLEDGDVVYIPQRPSTVTVMGDVMQAGTFPFDPKLSAKDYIDRAGGYGQDAESDESFVVYPDGTAKAIDSSWLSFGTDVIPPGSVIYIPRNFFPVDWWALTTTLASIMRDFAVSAASLAVISQHN